MLDLFNEFCIRFNTTDTGFFRMFIDTVVRAVNNIGIVGVYTLLETDLEVCNYRASKPNNYQTIERMLVNGTPIRGKKEIMVKLKKSNDTIFFTENYTHFTFSFEKGTAKLIYRGLVLDCDGIPEIPYLSTHDSLKQAILFFVAREFTLGRYIAGTYAEFDALYQSYTKRARFEFINTNSSLATSKTAEIGGNINGFDFLNK